jgi:hypothetical protein
VLDALDDALTIVGRCHETYLEASPMLRRLMNQVIFHRILIRTENIEGELQSVFGHITSLGRGYQAPAKGQRPENAQDPRLFGVLVPTSTKWCARVDSNHHGENSPQGPQPDTGGVDRSGGVQIVQFVGVCWTHRMGLEGWMFSKCSHGPVATSAQLSGSRAIPAVDSLNSAQASSGERSLCAAKRLRKSQGSSGGRFEALSRHTCARSGVVRWQIPAR